ncbi:bifunctional 2-polyprenyl-6-hydroxyphenol methylase/3-demethylubiquinol 3-O-methyltransferase UbiG [Geobacter sp.]|uniref:class I SAM-dependent methyltransferase n=1 Tax=Geobacter sp. TaxID=46610 RepID=UPI0027B96CD2|nr:class I SAM-dependent methyltransferase [Geobacter sp.]
MSVYGKDFAAFYSEKWDLWGARMLPFLSAVVAKEAPQAKTWLDLCCGAGSLLKIVGENGFQATGIDLSEHQVEHARRKAPGARVLAHDIRALELNQRFDIVTCMFDSLNYLVDEEDLFTAFSRAKSHLSDDGIFICDMNTYEGLKNQWCAMSVTHEPDLTLVIEASFDADTAIGRLLFTGFSRKRKHYQRFQEEHVERGYRPEEIERSLHHSGLIFRKYDGYSFGRPKKRSGRLLYVCKKNPPISIGGKIKA